MKARAYPAVLSLAGALLGVAAARAADVAPLPHVFLDPQEPLVAEIRRLGETTIDRAGTALVLEVRRVLARTPTIDAIGVMHLRDYKLPATAPGSILTVTRLQRTSLQVRNPANAPDAADRAALDLIKEQLQQGDPVAKVLVQRVTLPGQPPEWRVYRPLSVMNECLQCHGTAATLAPGVAERLKELYPDDTAVNYRASAWRGLLRVSITDQPVGK
jgi:mono/diheme cytochrome c family protein